MEIISIDDRDDGLSGALDKSKFLEAWRQRQEKEQWLFAVAVVKAGLEREGNYDSAAREELSAALDEFDISPQELDEYLEENRVKLLQFLSS